MKTKNFDNMKKDNVIKTLSLKQRFHNVFGEKYPKGVEVFVGVSETKSAKYVYTLDNLMSVDLNEPNTYFLTVERYSKTATVWSELFNAYIPRKTNKVYLIKE